MWFEWDTKEEFETWHNALCISLDYPLTPVNQQTGLPDANAQKVTAYTKAFQVDDKFIAFVDEEHSKGLIPTDLRPLRTIVFENPA